ncbi:MAG: hypothetical protein LC793_13150 [Thermomicrobia bacterium]|nr:hypothetical protein [Thermomicrobia bacterium]MCA1723325.1 hypothetical protein [Thermomicrobia bacterium]
MTSEQIEAALVAYLDSGEADAVAGLTRLDSSCPVARACRAEWHHRYTVFLNSVYSVAACGPCATLTPSVACFVALVDAEKGRSVTFARARDLFEQAKEVTP